MTSVLFVDGKKADQDTRVRYRSGHYAIDAFTTNLVTLRPQVGAKFQVRRALVTLNGKPLDECTLEWRNVISPSEAKERNYGRDERNFGRDRRLANRT
jgi:hypothetical protein